jgi:serine/threonine protein kinase
VSGHPNVVTLYDMCETDEKIYMVMDYVPGGSLLALRDDRHESKGLIAHKNKEGKITYARASEFTEDEAQQFCWDMCRGLVHCRNSGVSLCDVQPKNLLLDARGVLLLSDFGLSANVNQFKYDKENES